jgi:drug/metabolite transporter (DMT)-like permease
MSNVPHHGGLRRSAELLASPYVGLTTAALLWSGNFVVGRALRGQISPLALNFWRWTIALGILLVFTHGLLWAHRRTILREWKLMAALGLTGIAAFHTCVYIALVTTSALNALLLLVMTPLLTVFGAWMVFRDPVTPRQLLGLGVALVGAVLLIARGSLGLLMHLQFGRGDLWMLLAVALWTAYSLLLKKRPAELPQSVLLTASTFAGILCMLPVYLWSEFGEELPRLSTQAVWGLLYVSLFASVFAFLLWNRGVSTIGPNRASTFIYLMPFFGAVLSFMFLGEGVEGYQATGGLLIFLGIALMNWRRSVR